MLLDWPFGHTVVGNFLTIVAIILISEILGI